MFVSSPDAFFFTPESLLFIVLKHFLKHASVMVVTGFLVLDGSSEPFLPDTVVLGIPVVFLSVEAIEFFGLTLVLQGLGKMVLVLFHMEKNESGKSVHVFVSFMPDVVFLSGGNSLPNTLLLVPDPSSLVVFLKAIVFLPLFGVFTIEDPVSSH